MRTFFTIVYIVVLGNLFLTRAEEIYPRKNYNDDDSHPVETTKDSVASIVENLNSFKRLPRNAYGGYGIGVGYPYLGAMPSK